MLKRFVFAFPLVLTAVLPALAADPSPPPPPDALEASLSQQWTGAQQVRAVAEQNLGAAIKSLMDDRRALRARVAEVEKLCGKACEPKAETPAPKQEAPPP